MLQSNVVWCIHSRREIVLTIQSDNGKQGYKVGGKKYRRPKVVLSQRPLRTVLQRLDSETRGMLSSQRAVAEVILSQSYTYTFSLSVLSSVVCSSQLCHSQLRRSSQLSHSLRYAVLLSCVVECGFECSLLLLGCCILSS